jgi:hypothetical protein
VDEIGLLLTFGNYYASVSYTVVVGILILASGWILARRYRVQIAGELRDAVKNRAFVLIAFSLAVVASIYLRSTNMLITIGAASLMVAAAALLLAHVYLFLRGRHASA